MIITEPFKLEEDYRQHLCPSIESFGSIRTKDVLSQVVTDQLGLSAAGTSGVSVEDIQSRQHYRER